MLWWLIVGWTVAVLGWHSSKGNLGAAAPPESWRAESSWMELGEVEGLFKYLPQHLFLYSVSIQDPKLMKQCHLHSEKVFLPQLILEPSSQTFPGLCLWVILDPVTLIVNINHYSV